MTPEQRVSNWLARLGNHRRKRVVAAAYNEAYAKESKHRRTSSLWLRISRTQFESAFSEALYKQYVCGPK